MSELIERIKKHEGFVGYAYKDTEGFDTIGYGTKLPLSDKEAHVLLTMRLNDMTNELRKREPFVDNLPEDKQEVIFEMCYQMGVGGVLGFKKMWNALKGKDYLEAGAQMLNSKWANQTPNRANSLYKLMIAKSPTSQLKKSFLVI